MRAGDLAIIDATEDAPVFEGTAADGWVALEYAETVLKGPIFAVVVASLCSSFSGAPFSLIVAANGRIGWIAEAQLRSVA